MYQPAAGDRIIVRRTHTQHSLKSVMTGTVKEVITTGEVAGFLLFCCDQGGRCYLGTREVMAAAGWEQTVERLES